MDTKVYDCMMSNPPVIDKEYISDILNLSKSQLISNVEVLEVTETNTALVIKFKALIKEAGNDASTRSFFIKTIKYDAHTHVYDSLSLKEAKFYKLIQNLDNVKLPMAKCFDSYISEDKEKYLLLLEDASEEFSGPDQNELSSENIWISAASSLAKFHAAFWNSEKIGSKFIPIDNKDKIDFYIKRARDNYEKFINYVGDRFDNETIKMYNHAIKISLELERERYERLVNKNNITLIHGDSHIYNFMFPHNKNKEPIIVDFQFWSSGIGAGDVAHLTRESFPKEGREKLHRLIIEEYHKTLLKQGVQGYSFEDCLEDYRKKVACMLLIPVWQYACFNVEYDEWIKDIPSLVLNYKSLKCDELL